MNLNGTFFWGKPLRSCPRQQPTRQCQDWQSWMSIWRNQVLQFDNLENPIEQFCECQSLHFCISMNFTIQILYYIFRLLPVLPSSLCRATKSQCYYDVIIYYHVFISCIYICIYAVLLYAKLRRLLVCSPGCRRQRRAWARKLPLSPA